METETIDKLFLELAQFTRAATPDELAYRKAMHTALENLHCPSVGMNGPVIRAITALEAVLKLSPETHLTPCPTEGERRSGDSRLVASGGRVRVCDSEFVPWLRRVLKEVQRLAEKLDWRAAQATEDDQRNGKFGDWCHNARTLRQAARIIARELAEENG